MSAVKIIGVVLIVAGIAGLLYGKFSYTKETHDIKLGPLEMSVAEKQTVNVPVWAREMWQATPWTLGSSKPSTTILSLGPSHR